MSTVVFESYLKNWTDIRSSEVSKYERPNFVSTDLALDAFNKGIEIGRIEFEEKIKNAIIKDTQENIEIVVKSIKNLMNVFTEKKLDVYKLFINVTPNYSKVIVTVNPKQHYSETFEKFIDPLISDTENKYFKIDKNIEIFTLDESENLDLIRIKNDGYSFGFDIINEKPLY